MKLERTKREKEQKKVIKTQCPVQWQVPERKPQKRFGKKNKNFVIPSLSYTSSFFDIRVDNRDRCAVNSQSGAVYSRCLHPPASYWSPARRERWEHWLSSVSVSCPVFQWRPFSPRGGESGPLSQNIQHILGDFYWIEQSGFHEFTLLGGPCNTKMPFTESVQ